MPHAVKPLHALPATGPVRHERGASLVEVLVAIVVLSVALVGAAGVQMQSMKFGQVSQQRSTAVQQASALIERMRSNVAGAAAGSYLFDVQYANVPQAMIDIDRKSVV